MIQLFFAIEIAVEMASFFGELEFLLFVIIRVGIFSVECQFLIISMERSEESSSTNINSTCDVGYSIF